MEKLNKGLKIVHIATSEKGGAGIAAHRLHEGLIRLGMDSIFLTIQNKEVKQSKIQLYPGKGILSRIYNKLARKYFGHYKSQGEKNVESIKGLEGSYEIFSFPYTDFRLENLEAVKNADIINLHWVAGLLNYPTFFNKVHKPVVWTLHDMNPFLGGFHYEGDSLRNKALESIEKKLQKQKEAYITQHKNLTVVAPSKWLAECAKKSVALRKYNVQTIPYGLDLTVYRPINKAVAREVFNLPQEKKVLLFVAEKVSSIRKGFDILSQALYLLKQEETSSDFLLAAIGEFQGNDRLPPNVVSLGSIHDGRLMSLAYNAADVYILPSREDNLPNVMLEAMSCGIPVIAFNVGGMKDVIISQFNGLLVDKMDACSLLQAIRYFLANSEQFDRKEIREFAEDFFSLNRQANQYIGLYEQLLIQ